MFIILSLIHFLELGWFFSHLLLLFQNGNGFIFLITKLMNAKRKITNKEILNIAPMFLKFFSAQVYSYTCDHKMAYNAVCIHLPHWLWILELVDDIHLPKSPTFSSLPYLTAANCPSHLLCPCSKQWYSLSQRSKTFHCLRLASIFSQLALTLNSWGSLPPVYYQHPSKINWHMHSHMQRGFSDKELLFKIYQNSFNSIVKKKTK